MENENSKLLACPSCDLIYDVSGLVNGQKANCSRCQHNLTVFRTDELQRVVAFSCSALITLMLACSFPFMQFKAAGLESVMTLPKTAIELWNYGMPDLAFLVAAFIILIPAAMLLLILFLTIGLLLNKKSLWLRRVCLWIFTLKNWSMVEVFFIGVLVSLVKIAKMATVVLGISFWAYAAFAILFILAVSSLDRFQYWRRIEALDRA